MITNDIDQAVKILRTNGIIGMPTETVYGLAGSAFSDIAINQIYSIKNRPFENPLIVHIPTIDFLDDLVYYIPDELKLLMQQFAPGPITFLLPKKKIISDLVTAGKPNVAVRIPSHPVTSELLKKVNLPVVAPSANPFQRISPVTAQQVNNYFEKDNLVVLDGGKSTCGIESTIIGFENGKVVLYREGFITQSEIEKVLNTTILVKTKSKDVEAPGMYKKHYAPLCDLIVALDIEKELQRWNHKNLGVLTFDKNNIKCDNTVVLSDSKSTKEALSNLYNALHEMEMRNVDLIITELFPNDAYGAIINERLIKASN